MAAATIWSTWRTTCAPWRSNHHPLIEEGSSDEQALDAGVDGGGGSRPVDGTAADQVENAAGGGLCRGRDRSAVADFGEGAGLQERRGRQQARGVHLEGHERRRRQACRLQGQGRAAQFL